MADVVGTAAEHVSPPGTWTSALSHAIARAGARLLRSRTLMRAPIWIYRARLGFLFGSRMLLLEHVGRKSGRRRQAVLEIVDQPKPEVRVAGVPQLLSAESPRKHRLSWANALPSGDGSCH
jgi:hypothetical protein